MPDPEAEGSENDGGEEVSGELVITGGDGTEVFELVEEALDEVALAVEGGVDRAADADVALAGDMGSRAAGLDEVVSRDTAMANRDSRGNKGILRDKRLKNKAIETVY